MRGVEHCAAAALAVVALNPGCKSLQDAFEGDPVPQCGTWTVTHSLINGPDLDPYIPPAAWFVDAEIGFQKLPGACEVDCTCGKILFMQFVSVISDGDPADYTPPELLARTVNGWAVDATEGSMSPYYGFLDEHESYPESTMSPGSSYSVMHDTPGGQIDRAALWRFLTVAVCRDFASTGAGACHDQVLGYLFWAFKADDTGKPYDVKVWDGQDGRPATTSVQTSFVQAALDAWNAQRGDDETLKLL